MTGRDIVSAALKLNGSLASSETAQAAEAVDGLAVLNRLLGSWSNESLLIHAKVREEFALTPSDGSYAMGSGANFNTSRPIKIEEAAIEVVSGTPDYEVPLKILRNAAEWAAVIQKDATSELPEYLFASGTHPSETIELYPVPTVANNLVLYSQKPLTEITTLDTSVSLPPGYVRALIYNLALDLAPEYGKQPSELVMLIATESKAALKRSNHRARLLRVDPALTAPSGNFNMNTGE